MRDHNTLLSGKRVFVTTATQGLGQAIAVLFAQQGAHVVIGGRKPDKLKKALSQLQAIDPHSEGYLVDFTKGKEVEAVCNTLLEKQDGVDILVNVVGVNNQKVSHTYTDDEMYSMFESNFFNAFRAARSFIPAMLERGKGVIVNISSLHAIETMPNYFMYASTKGAMNAGTRAMALDYADKGIRVNAICPGLILSDFVVGYMDTLTDEYEKNAYRDMLYKMQPMKPGVSQDIAEAALFLASDLSSYITGQTLVVDGGASIKAHGV
ncbi:MAG: SDR family oxidoreductase [Clostridia bacterium]|nr:SDR family oxidoreductase [Clostridia bacterium]